MKYPCPIKLLSCHTLRTEAVSEESWTGSRQSSSKGTTKRVVWTHPKRPVIYHINGNSEVHDLDKPSISQVVGDWLTEVQNLLGIVEPLTSHDIRRGAAFEASSQPGCDSKVALERAREVLGHSYQSLLDRTTEKIRLNRDGRHVEEEGLQSNPAPYYGHTSHHCEYLPVSKDRQSRKSASTMALIRTEW